MLRLLVRIKIIFTNNFIAKMRFLFILYVVLTAYCSTVDRFQKWQEDIINNEGLGLGVAHHAFANNNNNDNNNDNNNNNNLFIYLRLA